jgi:hypothetical protein
MKRYSIIFLIFSIWIIIAILSTLAPVGDMPLSKLTTTMAMFISGAVLFLYRIANSFFDIERHPRQKIFDIFIELFCSMLVIGYFTCVFLNKNETINEIIKIFLSTATAGILLTVALNRFFVIAEKLKSK